MLCQNCKKNDATTHLKRIINGEAAEIHICSACAKSLGVVEGFPVFLPAFGLLDNLFSGYRRSVQDSKLICETCGFTFEDIVNTGKPGCPDCYRTFGDKLAPTIRKIHGRTTYTGKTPHASNESNNADHRIQMLNAELGKAIDEQNFERAAQIRDELRTLTGGN